MLGMVGGNEAAGAGLVGRAAAISRLHRAVDAACAGTADRVVVIGPPGSGRTALVDDVAAAAGAAGAGVTVLRADAVAAEAALAHAGLFDLCRPVLDLIPQLPEPAATVLGAALGTSDTGAWGAMAVGAALLSLLTRAAQDGPVLVLVDDADRLDQETLDALLFAVRRLQHDPVAVVLAGTPEIAERLGPVADGSDRIDLEPLGREDAILVLERSCPVAPDAAVRESILDLAQGLPLALVLLPRSLSVPQLKGRWPLPDPLPSAARLDEVVAGDLDAMPESHRRAMLVAAASLTGSQRAVAAALAALDVDRGVIDDLVCSGHLLVDRDRLRFARPLLRSAAYGRASASDRRQAHLALSQVAGGEVSLEQRARHESAASVGPDPAVARLLEEAADDLRARGASTAAAALRDRAVALSVSRPLRARRRVAAAETLLAIGETERARVHIEVAEGEAQEVEVVAAARHLRGRLLAHTGAGGDAQAVLVQAARASCRADPARAVLMLCEAALISIHGRRFADGDEISTEAVVVAGNAGAASSALAGLVRGTVLVAAGRTREGRALLRTHRGGIDPAATTGPEAPVVDGVVLALVWAERYREARRLVDVAIDERRRTMALGLLPTSLSQRALLRARTGHPIKAFADAVEALRLMEGGDDRAQRAGSLAVLCSVEASLGLRSSCLAHVRQCLDLLGERGVGSTLRLGVLSSAAAVEHATGHPEAALRWLGPLRDAAAFAGGNPGTVMWEPDLVEALAITGHRDEAAALLDAFESRALAAGNRRALGAAARARGLLASDDAVADAAFAASVEHYSSSTHPGRGRTYLLWGERLARTGPSEQALVLLRQAEDVLELAGCEAWAARARAALAELGATPTPSVRRRPPLADLDADVIEVALLTAAGFDADKVAEHVLASRRTVLRLLAEATAALGERPGPAWLRGVDEVPDAGDDDTAERASEAPAPHARAERVEIRVLGGFAVAGDRTPPEGLGAKLLRLLAVSPPRGLPTDEVLEHLWPDLEPEKGRVRLRNVLSRLRATSGELVVRAGTSLRLADGVEVDLRRFLDRAADATTAANDGDAAAAAIAEAALASYGGELLPGSPYEPWAAAPRERARRRVLELLELVAAHRHATGLLDEAVAAVEQAIALDPYDEERYVRAAEVRRDQGRHGAALALLQRGRAVVRELGLAPSRRLVEVEASLRPPDRQD